MLQRSDTPKKQQSPQKNQAPNEFIIHSLQKIPALNPTIMRCIPRHSQPTTFKTKHKSLSNPINFEPPNTQKQHTSATSRPGRPYDQSILKKTKQFWYYVKQYKTNNNSPTKSPLPQLPRVVRHIQGWCATTKGAYPKSTITSLMRCVVRVCQRPHFYPADAGGAYTCIPPHTSTWDWLGLDLICLPTHNRCPNNNNIAVAIPATV